MSGAGKTAGPGQATAQAPSLVKALALYTSLRLGLFGACFLVAVAIVLPSTEGAKSTRVLLCALVAAIVSVPLGLIFGRKLRSRVTAALLAGREARDAQDRDYDARVRAGRERRRAASDDSPDGAA